MVKSSLSRFTTAPSKAQFNTKLNLKSIKYGVKHLALDNSFHICSTIYMAKKGRKNNPAKRFFLPIILLFLLFLSVYFIKSKYFTQDSKQHIAALPTTPNSIPILKSVTLTTSIHCPDKTFNSVSYSCNPIQGGSYRGTFCKDALSLIDDAVSACTRLLKPPPTNVAPLPSKSIAPSISPTPPPSKSYSCAPNAYIAGTYCISSNSCYDIYCNASGSGTKDTIYGSPTCSFCANYSCNAGSFIAGTYFDPSLTRSYDVYCNSLGNGTVKRYY